MSSHVLLLRLRYRVWENGTERNHTGKEKEVSRLVEGRAEEQPVAPSECLDFALCCARHLDGVLGDFDFGALALLERACGAESGALDY